MCRTRCIDKNILLAVPADVETPWVFLLPVSVSDPLEQPTMLLHLSMNLLQYKQTSITLFNLNSFRFDGITKKKNFKINSPKDSVVLEIVLRPVRQELFSFLSF